MDQPARPRRKIIPPPSRWRKLRHRLGWFILLSLCALATVGYAALRFGSLPANAGLQPTQIYDVSGAVIDTLQGGLHRLPVKLDQISPSVVQATLAIEDRRFYEHGGIDIRGLARAAWVDLRHMRFEQGASTLTQQLARNLYLSHERTWKRKVKEAWYAAQLEQAYTKEQILELYLNHIYYGHGAYGIEAAAQLYYDKPAAELTLAESALLAGIPKGPRYYSPHLRPADALARRNAVLQAMQETGRVSRAEAGSAMRAPLGVRPLPERQSRTAPYFTDYVRKLVVEEFGVDEQLLNAGGYKIYTTLDSEMQRIAEETVASKLPGGESELQAALVAIDPRNGHVKAMIGGRSYRQSQFNRVFAATRQPGSSFKPILYAAALERGTITATTRFRSEPTLFYFDNNRQIYRPSNFSARYFHAEIGLRQAISASDNIYAVNTLMQVGTPGVIDMARRLGISAPLKEVPSLALGTSAVSPFEMAGAFAVFAAEGQRFAPIAVTRIVDPGGKLIYEAHPRGEQVLSPALAYVTTQLLESVFDKGGTAYRIASMLKRPVAGKTGTTDSDAWFVGYTPELTTAVWLGHDQGRAITSSEAHRAAPMFAAFMEKALTSQPPGQFVMPEGVVRALVDPATHLLAAADCAQTAVLETFLAGTEPTQTCVSLHPQADAQSEQPPPDGTAPRPWWKRLRLW